MLQFSEWIKPDKTGLKINNIRKTITPESKY